MNRTDQKTVKNMKRHWLHIFERGLIAPFLFSIQPVIQLFSINVSQVAYQDVIRSLLASILFCGTSMVIVRFFMSDWVKMSLVTSMFVLFFYSFGDLNDWLQKQFRPELPQASYFILSGVAVLILFWMWYVQKKMGKAAPVNLFFNFVSTLLFFNSSVLLIDGLIENGVLSFSKGHKEEVKIVKDAGSRPDIYFIVLDGYGRRDILTELYQFDNSDFIARLGDMGFYVAEQSNSNYIQMLLSLSSTLNMNYIPELRVNDDPIKYRQELIEIIHHSAVRNILAKNGYQMISFQNAFNATVTDAETFYDSANDGCLYPITEFESLLIQHTMLRVLLQWPVASSLFIEMPYETHRQQILSAFEHLREIPTMEGDYFIYVHIIAPHPPFVFGEDGKIIPHREPFLLSDANHYLKTHSRRSYIAGYRGQIEYVNTLVLETVDKILKRSETPPIIIIQGDHGPGAYLHWGSLDKTLLSERFGIMNAYYFPGQKYDTVYSSISPVNSFRVVLNQLFGSNYELLPDRHYYSEWNSPLEFTEVNDLSSP